MKKCKFVNEEVEWTLLCCPIEAESSPVRDAGGSANANVLDALLK